MKQLKSSTRYTLITLATGLLLSLLGLILGGWQEIGNHLENSYQVQQVEFDNLQKINSSTNLTISTSDVEKPTLYFQVSKKHGSPIVYELINGSLTIEDNNDQGFRYDGFLEGIKMLQENQTQTQTYTTPTLLLPAGSHLDELTGGLFDGNANLEDMTVDKLDISINNGNFLAKKTTIHSTNIVVWDGDIDLQEVKLEDVEDSSSDQLNHLTVENGNIRATGLQVIGNYDVLAYDGDIDLTIHKESLKDLAIEELSADEDSEQTTHGNPNAKNKLTLHSQNGDIYVQ
ncbi:TPA: DUF4097 family beta strand repeat-containing protein [Streptococcus suis]